MNNFFGMRRLAAGLVLMLLAGCGGPAPSGRGGETASATPPAAAAPASAEDQTPADGDWLLFQMRAEMSNLNPLTGTDVYNSVICSWIFDGLLDRDSDSLEVKPYVAERWEVSPDHLTYTFYLRKDVVFSDGKPLTAKDVKFSFDKIMDPTTDAPHLRNYFQDFTACETPDDYTVRFTASKPYFLHLLVLSGLPLMPEHIYSQGNFNQHPNNRMPIGSGGYVLEKWDTGLQVVLARNPKYWGKKDSGLPHVDKLIYKLLTDDNASFQMLLKGELDRMELLPEMWTRRTNTEKFTQTFNKVQAPIPSFSYIAWNQRKPFFADKRARRAMTLLLDRESVKKDIYLDLAKVVTSDVMPGMAEYNENIKPLPFDPKEAVRLLDEAGWKDSDGDGLRDKDGVPFRFEVLTTNNNQLAERMLTLFKEELGRAGVEMTLRPMEWASLIDKVDVRQFDAVTMRLYMNPDHDPYQIWHSSQVVDKGSNLGGFVNAEADKIMEDARTEFDKAKRIAMYRRMQEIIVDEQPYTFMLSPMRLEAMDKRIQGVKTHPFGMDERSPGNPVSRWFVPAARQRYGK